MDKLLLHVCCAPCSTHAIETLKRDYDVTLFFSNSNIFPEEEYRQRLKNAKKIAHIYRLRLIEDKYDHRKWRDFVKGLEHEPEQGKRCLLCFKHNLARAAEYAEKSNFDLFTTTLTISPHKDTSTIFMIGKSLETKNLKFLEKDLKKLDGFKHSIELSKEYNLYRQNYCGCEFSKH